MTRGELRRTVTHMTTLTPYDGGDHVTTRGEYLSPRELAVFLSDAGLPVTEDRARAWIREGKIPSIGLPAGRRHFVARSVADDILAGKFTNDDITA